MALIKTKVGGKILEFPYDDYGLRDDGSYKIKTTYTGKTVDLQPNGYDNSADFMYSCSSSVAELLEKGKTVIYSDETESHRMLWKTVRDGIQTSDKNDVLHLGYKRDHALANLGDDFIEIDNRFVSIAGDEGQIFSPEGGVDVMMVRCGDAYLEGDGNSDHYYINLGQECIQQGYTKNIVIDEISHGRDANILHLCSFSFKETKGNIIDTLISNGIHTGLTDDNVSLALYFTSSYPLHNQEADIIINHFCDNYNFTAINAPIAAIADKDGVEISLNGLSCADIAQYLEGHKLEEFAGNENSVVTTSIEHNKEHNFSSKIKDYITHSHIISDLEHLVSDIGEYLGFSHHHTN